MLLLVQDISNPLLQYIKDDPVRPEIPAEFRVGKNKFVSSIVEEEKPQALETNTLVNGNTEQDEMCDACAI